MAKGRKPNNSEGEGVLKLIKFNPEIIEENNIPNLLIDEYAGVCIDKNGNWELMKIKQTTVSKDNIKSTTNIYGDKYKIGDTFQEWISMDKYLGSYEGAVECYSNMKFNNEVSKLKYCKDVKTLIKIRQDIHDGLNNFMIKNVVPEVAKQISSLTKEFNKINSDMQLVKQATKEAIDECNKTVIVAKDNRKIIVQEMPKHKKTKTAEEEV